MARKRDDLAAAKAKKQKTILIVGGVLLLAVAAIQVPKLLKGGSQPEAAPAATTEALVATGTTSGGTTVVPASTTVVAAGTGAVVAGIALPGKVAVRVAPSQLASFTLFEVKDPFAPGVNDQPTAAEIAADAFYNENGEAPPAGEPAADAGAGDTGSQAAQETTSAEKPPPIVYATINLDGKTQQLKVKDTFPADEPLFVLRSVTKKQAKIGVAGGTFDDGQAVILNLGKKVTLVNTATGVRYVLKLVYTGATPEVIEGFTTGADQPATTEPAAGASPTTTAK